MRRVLIITYDFPPRGATGAIRATKFARYLPEFGWQPVVVAATPTGGMRDDALLAELPPDLEVMRIDDPLTRASASMRSAPGTAPQTSDTRRTRLRRLLLPDPQIGWVARAVRAATARIRQGDIAAILTTSPPHSVQLAGRVLKRRFRHIPWVMDLRDVWSDSPLIPDLLTYKVQRGFERTCATHADLVVCVTDSLRRLVQHHYNLPDQRLTTITNGFDAADVPLFEPRPDRKALRLTYTGAMVSTRAAAAHGLFVALERLAAAGVSGDDLEVRFVGNFGPEIHAWAGTLAASGIVSILPFVSHRGALMEMAAADVLLLITSDDYEGRIAHPNKLFEYLSVGRPICALTPEGDVARLVRDAGVGLVRAPADVDGIVAALRTLLAQHQAGRLPVGSPADPRFARFERRRLTEELAARLDGLVSPAHGDE